MENRTRILVYFVVLVPVILFTESAKPEGNCKEFDVKNTNNSSYLEGRYTLIPTQYNCYGRNVFENNNGYYIFYYEDADKRNYGWMIGPNRCNITDVKLTAMIDTLFLEDVWVIWRDPIDLINDPNMEVKCTTKGCSTIEIDTKEYRWYQGDYTFLDITCYGRPVYQHDQSDAWSDTNYYYLYYLIEHDPTTNSAYSWRGWVVGDVVCSDNSIVLAAYGTNMLPENVTSYWEIRDRYDSLSWINDESISVHCEDDDDDDDDDDYPHDCDSWRTATIVLSCLLGVTIIFNIITGAVCESRKVKIIQKQSTVPYQVAQVAMTPQQQEMAFSMASSTQPYEVLDPDVPPPAYKESNEPGPKNLWG